MSLPAAQQRILNSIDHSLRIREPRLASMFDMFTRLTVAESWPAWEQLTSAGLMRRWPFLSRNGPHSGGRGSSARRRRSRLRRSGFRRVLVFCPLLTVLAVLGLLVGLNPDLVPASCRTTTRVTVPAAQVHASYCQKMLPAK